MKRREDGAVREVMKELLRSDLRFHKTDCGRFGAMTAWGLKDTSSRPAKDLGGTLRHTYITNLLYAGVDPKTVQYLAGHENSKTTMDIYAKDNSNEYHKRANFPENIEFSGISLYFDNSIRHHKNAQNFHGN